MRLSKTTAEDKSSNAPAKLSRDPRPSVASFVQVRGSIPLLWSQTPCLKYKIPIRIAPPSRSDPVFAEHARELADGYQVCVCGVCVCVWGGGGSGSEG